MKKGLSKKLWASFLAGMVLLGNVMTVSAVDVSGNDIVKYDAGENKNQLSGVTEQSSVSGNDLNKFMTQMSLRNNAVLTIPDKATLESCNNVLYLVSAGKQDTSTAPEGYNMGCFQSVVDQELGVDAVTGAQWGYVVEAPHLVYSSKTYDVTSITGSKRYNNNYDVDGTANDVTYTYESGKSGIYYQFQLPEGTYEVTVGFYNNWPARTVDIVLEETTVEDGLSLTKDKQIEKTHKISVTDGMLDVFVHNPDRSNADGDALLSYIIVKVPEVYDQYYLTKALEDYALTAEQKATYSPSSLAKYEEAYGYVERLSKESGALEEERVLSYYNKMVYHYEHLEDKGTPQVYTTFTGTSGKKWYDTDGTEIQAHGGQIQSFTTLDANGEEVTKWYWYGEDKTDGYRTVGGGVRVYSSTDLYNWTNEGVALRNLTDKYDFEEDYFKALYGDYTEEQKAAVLLAINDTTSVIERPKVIYNEATGKYIMWFHADGPTETSTSNYAAACAGVAISDSPTGPFKFLNRTRMNYVNGKHDSEKGMARDMNLFVDDDGSAYIIYSSEQNATMFISKLDREYTALAEDAVTAAAKYDAGEAVQFCRIPVYAGVSREAPAMFKHNGNYYLVTSGCTGWGANASKYAICEGDSPLGAWTDYGNPFKEDKSICSYGSDLSFGTQSTCVFEYTPGKYIYMGDRWNTSAPGTNELVAPTYVWLPVEFAEDGSMSLRPYKDWSLDAFEEIPTFTVQIDGYIKKNDLTSLPNKVPVTLWGKTTDYFVNWEVTKGDISKIGSYVTVKGTLPGLDNAQFTKDMFVYSEDMVYMVDCGTDTSSTYNEVAELASGLKNTTPNQAFSAENGWGYLADTIVGTKAGEVDLGFYTNGYWGDSSINPTYQITLDKGYYQITSGHYEWWNTSARKTEVIASYNVDGQETSVNLGTVSFNGTKGQAGFVTGDLEIPADNTLVTLTFRKASGSVEAATVAYFVVENKGYGGEFVYDASAFPEYVSSIKDMPKTMTVTFGGQAVETDVTWTMDKTDPITGDTIELTGITVKGNETMTHEAVYYSRNLQYFVDCNKSSDMYDEIAAAMATKNLSLKNDAADQSYSASEGWGLTTSPKEKGMETSFGALHNSGYYGKSGVNVEYKVTLNAGTYQFVSGHVEWWNSDKGKRVTTVTASYEQNGNTVTETLGSVTFEKNSKGSKGTVKAEFTIPADNTEVTLVFKKGSGSASDSYGVVSYFLIDKEVETADKSALSVLVAESLEEALYESAGWAAYEAAMEEGWSIYNDEAATQAQVNAVVDKINNTKNALVLSAIDRRELWSLLEETLKKDLYEARGWSYYNAALLAGRKVYDNADATQSEVDAAVIKIQDRKAALVRVTIDKSSLKLLLEEQLDKSIYETASWNAYEIALAAAKLVYEDGDATQSEVDASVQTVTDKKQALQLIKTEPTDENNKNEDQKDEDREENVDVNDGQTDSDVPSEEMTDDEENSEEDSEEDSKEAEDNSSKTPQSTAAPVQKAEVKVPQTIVKPQPSAKPETEKAPSVSTDTEDEVDAEDEAEVKTDKETITDKDSPDKVTENQKEESASEDTEEKGGFGVAGAVAAAAATTVTAAGAGVFIAIKKWKIPWKK